MSTGFLKQPVVFIVFGDVVLLVDPCLEGLHELVAIEVLSHDYHIYREYIEEH